MTQFGTATLLRADARHLPLADASVDLIVTSPPYFALRSYQDGGEHYDGQIGSEPSPAEFLEALWDVTRECVRVLKPTGSMFVNLGDKMAGSGGHNNNGLTRSLAGVGQGYAEGLAHVRSRRASTSGSEAGSTLEGTPQARRRGSASKGAPAPRTGAFATRKHSQHTAVERGARHGQPDTRDTARATRRQAPDRYNQSADVRGKSLMGLPWLYALGCTGALAALGGPDPQLDLILRAEVIWAKPNGLPESVKDRVHRRHEQWFHFTKEPRYYAATDEIREAHTGGTHPAGHNATVTRWETGAGVKHRTGRSDPELFNPLGKMPGSVWTVATEPLHVPAEIGDHFAAFPTEWPRRLILGWSPKEVCTRCGEGRRAVIAAPRGTDNNGDRSKRGGNGLTLNGDDYYRHAAERAANTQRLGDACACPSPDAPTRPGVVLDPFGGTGTTAMVARALGRHGITLDLSADYLRLAHWRIFQSGHWRKVIGRTAAAAQGVLGLDLSEEAS